jgi:hypothetical protein
MILSTLVHQAFAQVAQTWISDYLSGCPYVLKIVPNRPITIQFPSPVQFAIPSQKSVVQIHIKKQTVVIQLSNENQKMLQHPLHISLILKNQQSFHCTFVSKTHATGETINLLLVHPLNRFQYVIRQVMNLLEFYSISPSLSMENSAKAWKDYNEKNFVLPTNAQDSKSVNSMHPVSVHPVSVHPVTHIAPELHRAIKHLNQQNASRSRLQWVADSSWTMSDHVPIRHQLNLIYATIEQIFQNKAHIYVRIVLKNRSQPTFKIKNVYLLWSNQYPLINQESIIDLIDQKLYFDLSYWPLQISVSSGQAAKYLAIEIPRTILHHRKIPSYIVIIDHTYRKLIFPMTDIQEALLK